MLAIQAATEHDDHEGVPSPDGIDTDHGHAKGLPSTPASQNVVPDHSELPHIAMVPTGSIRLIDPV